MTKQDLLVVFKKLMSVYDNKKFNNLEETIQTYYDVLFEYDRESIERAAYLCIKECRFFPSPAEIISRIRNANLIYGTIPQPQIEANTGSYMEEQIEWLMTEFQEGGSLGYD